MAATKKPKKSVKPDTFQMPSAAEIENRRLERKAGFIKQLAEFLTKDQGMWSIKLEMNDPTALVWARLRSASTLFGYPNAEEAEQELTRLLK